MTNATITETDCGRLLQITPFTASEQDQRIKAELLATQPAPPPPPSKMIVGLDTGGWAWQAAIADAAGCAKHFRSTYGNYNSDSQMQMLANAGVTLMPLFGGMGAGSIGAINRASYAAAVVSWFKRYGKGGTFWAGKTDLGATTCEILNEPGNPYFWPDSGNYFAYEALIVEAHKALSAAFHEPPTLLVSYDGGFSGDSYGETLAKLSPDIFALPGICPTVHPYGGHGPSSALGNRERVTRAHSDTGLPVYVTEVGWPTAVGQPPTGDSLQWSEDQQVHNIVEWVEWCRGLGYVAATVNFNYADYAPNNYYGVVGPKGTPHKKSYAALKALVNA